ncbi:hypothetical protein ACET3Z_021277 [Daucus carota]
MEHQTLTQRPSPAEPNGEINMILNNFDAFTDLDISNYDWKCHVRVQSIWKGISREKQEFYGINVVFIDDTNSKIHAFMNKQVSEKFEKELVEGGLYMLSNFRVKEYVGDETHRAVKNPKHIYFTAFTVLEKLEHPCLEIEMFAFDFSAFEEIEKIANDNRFLIDIVGIVRNKRPFISDVKDGKEHLRLKFDITDGKSAVRVTFFNDLARLCDNALLEDYQNNTVIAISSGKVAQYHGRQHGKIKIRIMRCWRGATKAGVPFRGINLVVMDAMNNKIHAFIPGQNVDKFEEKIIVPNLFIVSDFEVQAYKADDKFRCLHNTKQLIFDGETKMKDIEDDNSIAKEEVFDFYDHADLKNIADKNLYLTVTFWDRMAEILNDEMAKETETPVIIIITSCKVGLWNGAVQLSNTAASKFYLNSSDPSVRELRKILKKPGTVLRTMGKPKRKIPELHSIDSIHTLGKEYIETEVITHVKFVAVDESVPWYRNVCTTCWNEVHINNDQFLCSLCNRIIPNADKKFQLAVMACDNSGELQILLKDRQVKTIIRKRVFDIDQPTTTFTQILKDLLNQNYTVKILISDVNVLKDVKLYLATNICKGFHDLAVHESETKQAGHAQPSSLSTHLQGLSQLNFDSQGVSNTTYSYAE